MEASERRTYVNGRLRLLLVGLLLVVSAVSRSIPAHAASSGTVVAWGNNAFGQTSVPAGLSGDLARFRWHVLFFPFSWSNPYTV